VVIHVVEYEIVDFSGEVKWTQLGDGTYVVDPLYVEEFLTTI
jgi:hypothetical protein